jgi:hypothetical protein
LFFAVAVVVVGSVGGSGGVGADCLLRALGI